MPFALASPAIPPGGAIPAEYTCDGTDISPPLVWSGAPGGTQSLVVVVDDPDAPGGTFHHWAAYGIPSRATGLPAGFSRNPTAGVRQARNDFGAVGYRGPCPPRGSTHRYRIELYALSRPTLDLPPGAPAAAVTGAASPYVIARAQLTGTYGH
ncbi:MAG: YbhB/YbcL family Raf kinase inhibitor-like protein [Alphaproteobacteria bacterium]